jgi:VWFA-related protein
MKSKLLLPALTAASLLAQKPPSNTRLVEVNVVVRDKAGPVANLTEKDFALFDRGKEQKIASFVASNNQVGSAPNLPANVFGNRPSLSSPPSGVTLVLLDCVNTLPQVQSAMQAQLVNALRDVKPSDHVVLAVLGDGLRVRNVGGTGKDTTLSDWLQAGTVAGGMNVDKRLHNTTEALVAIGADMRRFVGRKNVVWLAGLYPVAVDHYGAVGPPDYVDSITTAAAGGMRAAPDDPTVIDKEVFKTVFSPAMNALNFAGISIYPVDARGLVDQPSSQTAAGNTSRSRGSAQSGSSSPIPRGIDAIRALAEDSGGRVTESSNDIHRSIWQAITDAEVSYTLGYYVDDKSLDSRFHPLKVTVDRKDVEVHYRQGFVALPESNTAAAQRVDDIRRALVNPLPVDGIGMLGAYEKDQPKAGSLRVTVVISGHDIALQASGDQMTGEVELVVTPRSADGKDRGTKRQALGLKLNQAQYQSVMKDGMSLTATLEPAGDVAEVRAVVSDHTSGRLGSLIMPVK